MKNIKERSISDFDNEIIKVSNFKSSFIDDDPEFLEMLKRVSQKLNMQADFYSNSKELLESKESYQLLFVDLWLKDSEQNGVDLIRSLKSKHPFSDIVVLSGDLSPDTMALCSEFGVCDYIHKRNFDPYAVMDVIDRSESKFERWLHDQPKMKKYLSF